MVPKLQGKFLLSRNQHGNKPDSDVSTANVCDGYIYTHTHTQ